jgi:asparagine synthase (glutamine-hydrolysing)
MCGICGIVDLEGRPINKESIHKMQNQMIHRGPDDEGIYVDNQAKISVGLGQRRLKIIDLSSAGHQPMPNEDGTLQMVINGEIFNYQNLRQDLKNKGHHFRSDSDSEVVLHLYEEFGEGCLAYLRGMFAFAIWDKKENKLFLARDRLGKKPLLYYHRHPYFCFASEFSALLSCGLIDKKIDYAAIDRYLTFGYIPAPGSIYENVFKLLPAHYGTLKDGQFKQDKYWQLEYTPKLDISENEAMEELVNILKEAVSLRMASDVPLGAFLSGGVDSSTVVALMSDLASKVKTFSIGFEDTDFDELKYARNIAKIYSTDHHEFIVKPKAVEILPLLVERYGEPYADSSAIPTYYVCRETKKYVTVAINGDGGDESFAGYERYQAMALAETYNRLPGFFKNGIRNMFLHFVPDSANFKNKRRRIRRLFENISLPFYTRYCRWIAMVNDEEKDLLYQEGFKKRVSNNHNAAWLKDYPGLSNDMELADFLMATDIHTNLANDLLVKMDIASMANSLEARAPFLDQKVMEFAARLPAKYKLNGLIKKYILKKAIKNLVPSENINRKKMGFGVPIGKWFRTELKEFMKETLLSEENFKRGYFKPEIVSKIVESHCEGKKDYSFLLWSLLMLELWHKRFVD